MSKLCLLQIVNYAIVVIAGLAVAFIVDIHLAGILQLLEGRAMIPRDWSSAAVRHLQNSAGIHVDRRGLTIYHPLMAFVKSSFVDGVRTLQFVLPEEDNCFITNGGWTA